MTTSEPLQTFRDGQRQWLVHDGGKAGRDEPAAPEPVPVPEKPAEARQGMTLLARIYVGAVCLAGALVVMSAASGSATQRPLIFGFLLAASLLASIAKVEIAILGSGATLTACHVVDLLALLTCGADAAVLVAAWGGWTQCVFKSRQPNPLHQTAFSVASLALAMSFAAFFYARLGGMPGAWSAATLQAFAVAVSLFFVLNSALVAGAVSLTVGEPFKRVWFDFFFSIWPSYLIGACISALVAVGIERQSYWLVPILAAALAVIHGNYRSCLERMNDGITDHLTGLPNKRFVTSHVARELARARRGGSSLAIAVLDMNGFKRINDVHGHAGGDLALKHVAAALTVTLGVTDVCARYGGDEFVLVMPGSTGPDALRVVERVKEAVQSAGGEQPFGDLSLSAGVAVFPQDGDDFETLFANADSRMYQRKLERHRSSGPGQLNLLRK
jgi:diguanylate cyclase (GGDEF)-like protein